MRKVYCKAGRVELSEQEAIRIYSERKFIVTSYGIFQPKWHDNQPLQRVSFFQISSIKGLDAVGAGALRHRHALTAEEINHIVGEEWLTSL